MVSLGCRWAGRVALGAGAVLVLAAAASAHAILQRSTPPANSSLTAPPGEIVLVFSDPVVAGLSTATVTDSTGAIVSGASAVARDGRTLTAPAGTLPPGVYTVRWRVLSAADGHATSGFFLFGIGAATPAGTPVGTGAAAPSTEQVIVRWVSFAAAILLTGTVFFQFFVLRPGLARLDSQEVSLIAIGAGRLLRAVAVGSAVALFAGLIGEFLVEAATLLDTTIAGVWRSGTLWMLLGGTKIGYSALVRAAGTLILLVPASPAGRILRPAALGWFVIIGAMTALLGGPVALAESTHLAVFVLVATVYGLMGVMATVIVPRLAGARIPEVPMIGPVAAATVLAGFTVSSHAAGSGPTAAVVDWVHLMGAAVWAGGLVPLWLVLRAAPEGDRDVVARVLVPKFSQVAAIALATLAVTGVYSALIHIPSVQALTITSYGKTLLVKVALVLPAAVLGAYNRFVLRPRVEGVPPDRTAQRRFLRNVSAEGALGAAILLVVAVLTITPPAAVTMPAPAKPPLVYAGLAGPFRVELTISPAEPGWNRIEAVVRTPQGRVDPGSTRILVRLLKLDEDLDPVTVTLRPEGDRFVVEGGELGLPGWWELQLVVRQRGARDLSTAFPLRLGIASGSRADLAAMRVLLEALNAAREVRTWRELEQITDGAGGVSVTTLEIIRPDRLHLRTAGRGEAIIIGAARYSRDAGGPWERDSLPDPIGLEGPYVPFLKTPAAAALGRTTTCEGEPCRVVMWELSGGGAAFAAWIGLDSHRVYRLLMSAPDHYMTSEVLDLNIPLAIRPP